MLVTAASCCVVWQMFWWSSDTTQIVSFNFGRSSAWLISSHSSKLDHANLSSALCVDLWRWAARLYCFPSRTLLIYPSAMTPDSTARSQSPAFPNILPTVDIKLHIIWNFTISMIPPYLSGCFHAISVAFVYSTCVQSKTTAMLSRCRNDWTEIECRKISWMVDNSVVGTLIVGRYPIASAITSLCSLVGMLNPVQ